MDWASAFGALKILGIAVVAASGLWGIFHQPTTENAQGIRRVTRQGRVTIGLIVVGALVAVASFIAEQKLQARADEAAKLERSRLLHPIQGFRMRVWWTVPVAEAMPSLVEFGDRSRTESAILGEPHATAPVSTAAGQTLAFDISDESRFYPHPQVNGAMHLLTNLAFAHVSFYASDNPIASPRQDPEHLRGDYKLQVRSAPTPTLEYDTTARTITFEMQSNEDSAPERTGSIVSIPDLERARLMIRISDTPLLNAPFQVDGRMLRRLHAAAVPSVLEIEASNRLYRVRNDQMRSIMGADGIPTFVATIANARIAR